MMMTGPLLAWIQNLNDRIRFYTKGIRVTLKISIIFRDDADNYSYICNNKDHHKSSHQALLTVSKSEPCMQPSWTE